MSSDNEEQTIRVRKCKCYKLQHAIYIKGYSGMKGDLGPKGMKGDTGCDGMSGCQGIKGDKGDKGDKIKVRNYTSSTCIVHTIANACGEYIGHNVLFMAFMLHPTCNEPNCCVPCMPCKPHVSKQKSCKK